VLFRGAAGKDVVSRAWRRVKVDWEAWYRRDPAGEDTLRLVLDGTIVRVRLDRKATSVSPLVVLGIRRDGQKVLLAVRAMGGESEAAWRAVLDDPVARGRRTPEFLITGGAAGLEKALAALWPVVPAQRCTVHKRRCLLARAPERLHQAISADDTDMICAATAKEAEAKRRAYLRKWRLTCRAVADSLEKAGKALFAFTRLHPSRWKSARTTNAIERHRQIPTALATAPALLAGPCQAARLCGITPCDRAKVPRTRPLPATLERNRALGRAFACLGEIDGMQLLDYTGYAAALCTTAPTCPRCCGSGGRAPRRTSRSGCSSCW
jgi:hypothetical protein